MIHQCACCGGKVDSYNDDHEALEVQNEYGRVWYYYHPVCLDTLRSVERKLKDMGTPEKSSLPKKVVGIRGSWSGEQVPSA